jgi:hypothetical protein
MTGAAHDITDSPVAQQDLAWIASVRHARVRAVDRVSRGEESFSVLLHALKSDPLASLTFVVALTDVHGCLGKVAGRRLIASLSLDPLVRVGELTDENIHQLTACCG